MTRSAKHAAVPAPKNLTATVGGRSVGLIPTIFFCTSDRISLYFYLELLVFPNLRENKKQAETGYESF